MNINEKFLFKISVYVTVVILGLTLVHTVVEIERLNMSMTQQPQLPEKKQQITFSPSIKYYTSDRYYNVTSEWKYGYFVERIGDERNYMNYLEISGEDIIGQSFWLKHNDNYVPALKADYDTITLLGNTDDIYIVLNQKNKGIELNFDSMGGFFNDNPSVTNVVKGKNYWNENIIIITYNTLELKNQMSIGDGSELIINIPIELIDKCLFKPVEEYNTCFALAESRKRLVEAGADDITFYESAPVEKESKKFTIRLKESIHTTDSIILDMDSVSISDTVNMYDIVEVHKNGLPVDDIFEIELNDTVVTKDEVTHDE